MTNTGKTSNKLRRVKGSVGRTILDNSSDLSVSASKASASEIRESFELGQGVTVILDGNIVKIDANGKKTILGKAAKKEKFKPLVNIACHG